MPRSNDGAIRAVADLEVGPFVGAVNKAMGSLSSFAAKMGKVGMGITVLAGIVGVKLASEFVKASKEIKQYELTVVELAKVLEGGIPEAQVVAKRIGEMSKVMPSARQEMFKVGEIAARLGVRGVGNLREFTRVATMLGVATDLSADQAADAFARILKQTQTPISAFEQLGSVVNELANNMATSTSEIVESMRRNAPDMARLGFDAGQIAAISASVNEVSESASRAGTRIRRLAQSLSDPNKLQVFADAVDMSGSALRNMLKDDSIGALKLIVDKFREGGEAADMLAGNLDARVRQVLAQLAQNWDGLNGALAIYEEQMRSANSLSREYALFTDTIVGKQQMLKNRMEETRVEIGYRLLPALNGLLEIQLKLAGFFEWIMGADDQLYLIAGREKVIALREEIEKLREEAQKTADTAWRGRGGVIRTPDGFQQKEPPLTGYVTSIRESMKVGQEMNKVLDDIIENTINLENTGMAAFDVLDTHWRRVLTDVAEEGKNNRDQAYMLEILRQGKMAATEYGVSMASLDMALASASATVRMNVAKTFEGWNNHLLSTKDATINDLIPAISGLTGWVLKMGAAVDGASDPLVVYTDAATELIAQLEEEIRVLEFGADAAILKGKVYDEAAPKQKRDIERAVARRIELKKEAEAEAELAKKMKARFEERKRQAEVYKQTVQSLKDRLTITQAATDKEKKYAERMIEVREAVQDLVPWEQARILGLYAQVYAAEDLAEANEKLIKKYEEAQKEYERLRNRIDDMKIQSLASQFRLMEDIIEGVADSMVEAFESIVTGSGNAGEAVVNMIRQIAAELVKAQIMDFLFGLAESANIGPFKQVNAHRGAKQAMDTFSRYGSALSFFGKRSASGGSLGAGKMSLVGERGPELFIPSVDGHIVPNHKLGGETVVVNNHYTIQALDGASVREVLAKEQNFIAGLSLDTIQRHRSLKR